MSLITNQFEAVKEIFHKHEKYHHFSGVACIIVGILWLLNEGLNYKIFKITINYPEYYQILSWLLIAVLAMIIATIFTFSERRKHNKMIATIALKSILFKLALICLGTLALVWVFYQNQLILYIPALFMCMYGILILTSRDNLPTSIQYFGYLNFILAIIGFVFIKHINLLAVLALGFGHIITGIILIIHEKRYL